MTVSVVVVNYNAGELLERCLASLQAESSPVDREVILLDNASTDGSADGVAERFPGVRVIRSRRNLGFAGGVKRAVREASGGILLLLNPDAEVYPDTVGVLADVLLGDPSVGIAGCKIYDPDGRTLQHAGAVIHPNLITSHRGRGEPDQGQYDEPAEADYVTGAALAVPKDVFQRLGGLDPGYRPGYYEETELCLRARKHGLRVLYVPGARVKHHESASSGQRSRRFFYAYHRNRLRFLIRNHSPWYWVRRFAPAEWRWVRSPLPPDQRGPLVRAYLVNLVRLPLTVAGR